MGKGPRNYTELTLKRLYSLSGNQCAFPECPVAFTNNSTAINKSNICHIEDAEIGGRYRAGMSDLERASFDNLILLCPTHHVETNDVNKYTVTILKEMKQLHESKFLNHNLKKNPSMLMNTINAMADIELDDFEEIESLKVFDVKNKITYNEIKANNIIINEYKVYHEKINSLYDELERHGSIKKSKLLNNVRQIYLEVKGEYVLDSDDEMIIVKENADNIFNSIYDRLYNKMKDTTIFDEDILFGIRLVMVDAFIRCKILEEPI